MVIVSVSVSEGSASAAERKMQGQMWPGTVSTPPHYAQLNFETL